MNFVIMILINLAIAYLVASLQKKTRNSITPLTVDDNSLPLADEYSQYNLSYGTVETTGANCTWYGDVSTFKIYKKIKTEGGFLTPSSTQKVEAQNGYRIGFKMALGYGRQDLLAIKIDGKYLYNTTTIGSFTDTINKPSFFGLPEEEGGIQGTFEYYDGSSTQVPSAYLASQVGEAVPAYNNQTYFIFRSFYIGNNNVLKPMSFVTKRIPQFSFLNAGRSDIDGDCNPVNILIDLLMSDINGANQTLDTFDIPSFVAAHTTLFNEKSGLSFLVSSDKTIEVLKAEVLSHIDAVIDTDLITGKTFIKLNRQDYDVNTLFVYDVDNIINFNKYNTNAVSDIVTELKLTYTDKADDFKKKVITRPNDAARMETGQVVSKTIDYPAITTLDYAQRMVFKEMLPLSRQYVKCEIRATELPLNVTVGSVIMLKSTRLKIKAMPCRITQIGLGDTADSTLTLSLVQDLFSTVTHINIANQSKWVEPNYTAVDVDLKLFETPYLYTSVPSSSSGRGEVMTFAKNTTNLMIGYDLYNNTDTTTLIGRTDAFTPMSTLNSAIGKTESTIVLVNDSTLINVLNQTESAIRSGQNIAMIVEGSKFEFISFTTISGGVISGVKRGLVDSIPSSFTTSAAIYFFTYGYNVTQNLNYVAGETARLKAKTRTAKNELDLASATLKTLAIINRQSKPILPNNLKVNNKNYEETITIGLTELVDLTYSFRNKQKNYIQFYNDIDTVNTDNNSYRINFYNPTTNVLIKSTTITTNSYTFSDEATFNSGNLFNSLRMEVTAMNGSVESILKYVILINRV